jgi:uncharacterized coiled-coil protein SlyX
MKKTAALVFLLITLAACSSRTALETQVMEGSSLEVQLAEKDDTIADLEHQVALQQEELDLLREEYDALLARSSAEEPISDVGFMCESTLENMKYSNAASAIDILEGWFALQPDVAQIQGKYSTQFWTDTSSRIHTIRYISEDTGLSETATFLIFFEEGGWREGLLDMTEQCWLDFPN